jgi:hypothetical protein
MLKRLLRELSRLLPYINGQRRGAALFTVVLLLGMTHAQFGVPHLHSEPAPIQPTTVVVMIAVMGIASVLTGYALTGYRQYAPVTATIADVPMEFSPNGIHMGYTTSVSY